MDTIRKTPYPDNNIKGIVDKQSTPFRMSLRYKLAFPVLLFVTLMFFLLFYTTFQLVRGLIVEGVEGRLSAITSVFTETIKVPLILENRDDLESIVNWMGGQEHVLAVRIEDWKGKTIGSFNPTVKFPQKVKAKGFSGVYKLSPDAFVVALDVHDENRLLGRTLVLFSNLGIEDDLKQIFKERLRMALIMMVLLAILTTVVTWFGIRPLFDLEKTAKRILAGDLDARANVHSFDEIEDVGNAFNEMVSRLGASLDRLRSRTEALEESEEKFRLIVENASDIIFTLAPDGEIQLLNRGFSGYRREDILHGGLPLVLSVLGPESAEIFQNALEEMTHKKKPVMNIAISHHLHSSQTEIFYLVNLTPVIGTNGDVKLIQGIMRDVTEMKRIETMKESLIRDVAHELKTPTAKFQMTLTWFEKEVQKNEELKQYQEIVDILKNNVDRLMSTITSIMDLSKLESGVDRISKVKLDVNEILQQVMTDMSGLVRKEVELKYNLADEPLHVEGDDHMLYRLFVNLIQNAIKFTEVGKIEIKSFKDEDKIHIVVQDSGMGIEPEALESIFDRFVQKTAASAGIGVGLTICRDIAALHGGKIWAESLGLGKGAEFHILIPGL